MYVCSDVLLNPYQYTVPKWEILKRKKGNPGNKNKIKYVDCITAFDIETSVINVGKRKNKKDNLQSFMYVWQWQIGDKVTIMGRTWQEFIFFAKELIKNLKENEYIVVYVHNLSFEFQFLSGIYDFTNDEVFATSSRKILKCTMFNHLEFRCSYLHSNMSLDLYTTKMNVAHKKLAGKYDYKKVRWPYTILSEQEKKYCVNDVRGLVEVLKIEMEHDGDNLYTIPLTSTGYVRRDTKKAVREKNDGIAKKIFPTYEIYTLLREAFRGGNTHANRFYSGKIIENVYSYDRSSSYPDVLCNCKYPVTEFLPENNCDIKRINELIEKRGKALIFRIGIAKIELRDIMWGCPYISKDKCRNIINAVCDNGRILSADYLELTVTDIDFRIICDEYVGDIESITDVYSARYGKLPQSIIDTNIKYYKLKTELKNVVGSELLYMKSKNKLNSIYGMMAQNPIKANIDYNSGEYTEETLTADLAIMKLEKAKSKAFLAYQWGVWCTAWARYRLEDGIKLAGSGFVYCDTDSVKTVGPVDFIAYNRLRRSDSLKSGTYATDPAGEVHYMGVYEFEGKYEKFSTLGAKKYCYEQNGKLHATIAGVSKKDGGKELEKHGGIIAFAPGFVFRDAGGTEAIYNDENYGPYIMPNGETLQITKNVVIKDSTYELGITAEYARILEYASEQNNLFSRKKLLTKLIDNAPYL